MNDYMKYMSMKKKDVMLSLEQTAARTRLCDPTSDQSFTLQFSDGLKVYGVDPRDLERNELFLKGVHAIQKRSERYYENLERKGAEWFRQIPHIQSGDLGLLDVTSEGDDLDEMLEVHEASEFFRQARTVALWLTWRSRQLVLSRADVCCIFMRFICCVVCMYSRLYKIRLDAGPDLPTRTIF